MDQNHGQTTRGVLFLCTSELCCVFKHASPHAAGGSLGAELGASILGAVPLRVQNILEVPCAPSDGP